MRLIDADAFKDYIRGALEDVRHLYKDNGVWAEEITESFCKDIDEQPTVEAEPRWIPCCERLPSENGKYIVTEKRYAVDDRNHDGKYAVIVEEVDWDDGKWRRAKFFEVTAWMPLPEPYGGGETEQ